LEIETELITQEKSASNKETPKLSEKMLTEASVDKPVINQLVQDRIRILEDSIIQEQRSIKVEEIKSRRRLESIFRHELAVAFHRAKLHEQELLLQLDKQREEASLKEIERQRLLEAEQEKTRECRFQNDIEAEKRAQKDIETRDTHSSSRKVREYSSGKPRDRYRERTREGEKETEENLPESAEPSKKEEGEKEDYYEDSTRQLVISTQ